MNLPRRTFLKTMLATSASAVFARPLSAVAVSPAGAAEREFYELRCYRMRAGTRLKTDPDVSLLDRYLESALLPAFARLGIGPVGVFTELDVDKQARTATPQAGSPVWMLVPHATLDSFLQVTATLADDPALHAAGAAYLRVPKATPAFERIDSWLLRAFAGMPRMELPGFARNRTPTRVFEMRDYESHSETAALNKIAMFDEGEIALMRDLGMNPVMYGQALVGPDLPHLRYLTSGPDLASHLAAWSKFGPHPRWNEMKNNPRYVDNMTKATARFLTPKPFSQI